MRSSIAVLLLLPTLAVAQPPSTYMVGVAKIDITPDYPVRLSGFGFRRTESEGIRQRIWAKAIAISSPPLSKGGQGGLGAPVVVITTDNLGAPDELVQELGRRLKQKANVDPTRLAVTATHTHTAPMLRGVAPTLFSIPIPTEHQERIDKYTREFLDKLEKVALAALEAQKPAQLYWGIGNATLAMNRRTKGGPLDHDLPVLVVKTPPAPPSQGGEVRAIYFNYACHCVTLSENKIGGDWAGYAQEHLERMHPDVVALCTVGCGADSNPRTGVMKDRFDIASQQGEEIAAEVSRVLKGPLRPISGPIRSHQKRIDLDFDTHPTRQEWEEKAKRQDAIGYHARVNLERLDRGEKLPTKISYPIQSWEFGDSLAMVFLPGEVVVDYSLRLKRELDGRRLWINAYSNASPCYIPSERVLKEGGYEGGGAMVYYDQPTKLKPGLEQQIIDTVTEQLGKNFKSPVDPKKTSQARPLAPEQSLALIQTHKDLVVELVAAEPLVTSPVAIDFGPDGKLWVAEMLDYPLGLDGKYMPGGRVRYVTGKDGKFDKATTFLDNIPFPTGVTVWRKGVLVCAAPDILYAEDTDGDGKADVVKKLYTGFGTHNYQARVNSLVYGLDGWVYGSCGLFGGEITNFKGQKFKLGDRDFRIKPDTGELEPVTGRTQQGRVRDDWGNWFGCTNSVLCMHYPLDDHYLRRNPHVIPPATTVLVPGGPDPNRLFPLKQDMQLFKLSGGPGRTTAACGLEIYRDVVLGAEYAGNAFVCEPVNLLVHRLQLEPKGMTFTGKRAASEQQSEFLRSTDNWFRPVQVRTGPDGCLWVVDMYRYVIEHPRWIPDADLAKVDVRAGHDKGRIYRVRPKDRDVPLAPQFRQISVANGLDSGNGWQHDMAMQMVQWYPVFRLDAENVFRKSSRPQSRLSSLAALNAAGGLTPLLLKIALLDPDPGVRRHAVLFSERFLNEEPELAGHIATLATRNEHPEVLLQAAYSLGGLLDAKAAAALADILRAHANDPYLTAGILSGITKTNVGAVVDAVFGSPKPPSPALAAQLMAILPAIGDREATTKAIAALWTGVDEQKIPWQRVAIVALLEGLGRRNQNLDALGDKDTIRTIEKILDAARGADALSALLEEHRLFAVQVLGHIPDRRLADLSALEKVLGPRNTPAVREAALAALARIPDDKAANLLTENWKSFSPTLKGRVLDVLFGRVSWQRHLLTSIANGQVPASEIDVVRRQRLLEHKNDSILSAAIEVFGNTTNRNRQRVLDDYAALPSGDVVKGKGIYAKTCAACHRLGDTGHRVGPDLGPLVTKTPQFFLMEILDPNRNIDPRYVEYQVVTKSGRIFSGLLTSETATSITLTAQEGKQQVLLRNEIDELHGTGKSLMPEGLEKELNPAQMADLIAFLTSAEHGRVSAK